MSGQELPGDCMRQLGVIAADLDSCDNVDSEWNIVKSKYFKLVLRVHPDKGGDAATFRLVNNAFNRLRELYEARAIASFAQLLSPKSKPTPRTSTKPQSNTHSTPFAFSFSFYAEAAEEDVPLYKCEPARSSRSRCIRCANSSRRRSSKSQPKTQIKLNPLIPKGSLRVGTLNPESGTYSNWSHISCWRVPFKVWNGLPANSTNPADFEAALATMNEILLCGFCDLTPDEKAQLVDHVMDKSSWARKTSADASAPNMPDSHPQEPLPQVSYLPDHGHQKNSSFDYPEEDGKVAPSAESTSLMRAASSSSAATLVPSSSFNSTLQSLSDDSDGAQEPNDTDVVTHEKSNFFTAPRPGVNGPADFLAGKTIVLTGVFPEMGGGCGLKTGKDRVKAMCESFGARVTSAISGKTNLLVVGQEPGQSKVAKAEATGGKCQIISLQDLVKCIEGQQSLEYTPPPMIESFSAGYYGNGLGLIGWKNMDGQLSVRRRSAKRRRAF
ncbi:hypothetical protein HDU81_010128 [Chytriomyces hyalinus]|nr:hypothetical protein HDU81_010128 [Chytriomyces hyalinus]